MNNIITSVENRLFDFISEKMFIFIGPPIIPIPPTGSFLLGASSFFSSVGAASSASFSLFTSSFSGIVSGVESVEKSHSK